MFLLFANSAISLSFLQAEPAQATGKNSGMTLSERRATVLKNSEFSNEEHWLKDIKEVSVNAMPFPGPFEKSGSKIDMNIVRKAVELRCREHGLQIPDFKHRDWTTPSLSIRLIKMFNRKDGAVLYLEILELNEAAILASDMKDRASVPTYTFTQVACIGELHANTEDIQRDFLICADEFLARRDMDIRHAVQKHDIHKRP